MTVLPSARVVPAGGRVPSRSPAAVPSRRTWATSTLKPSASSCVVAAAVVCPVTAGTGWVGVRWARKMSAPTTPPPTTRITANRIQAMRQRRRFARPGRVEIDRVGFVRFITSAVGFGTGARPVDRVRRLRDRWRRLHPVDDLSGLRLLDRGRVARGHGVVSAPRRRCCRTGGDPGLDIGSVVRRIAAQRLPFLD